jgi:hypothetical protein
MGKRLLMMMSFLLMMIILTRPPWMIQAGLRVPLLTRRGWLTGQMNSQGTVEDGDDTMLAKEQRERGPCSAATPKKRACAAFARLPRPLAWARAARGAATRALPAQASPAAANLPILPWKIAPLDFVQGAEDQGEAEVIGATAAQPPVRSTTSEGWTSSKGWLHLRR